MSGVRATVLASQLLREAAGFFDNVADENPNLDEMMRDNAGVYRHVADALDADPGAEIEVQTMLEPVAVVDLAIRLLHDAGAFFENVAEQNPDTAESLPDTAEAYQMLADLLDDDPDAELPTDA